jgi:hypothetical protein
MMTFDSPPAGEVYAGRIVAALRGGLEGPRLHRHSSRAPLWKALAVVAAHTGRHDLKALVEVIRLLVTAPGSPDERADDALERIRGALRELGVRFLGLDNDLVRFELHGREHKPASRKRLGDMLTEIRQARLA